MEYFNHDTNASNDDKIMALRLERGGAAVDAYWVATELIYKSEATLDIFGNRHLQRSVSHVLNVDEKTMLGWFSTMIEIGLFERDVENPDAITSARIRSNLESYRKKGETARRNGKKHTAKPKGKPTAKQAKTDVGTDVGTDTGTDVGTIKENKSIGFYKKKPILFASDDAAAAEAAPPAAKRHPGKPICPLCYEPLSRRGSALHCDRCGDDFDDGKAVWV